MCLAYSSGIFYYSTPWLSKVKTRKKKGKDKGKCGKHKGNLAGEVGRERQNQTNSHGGKDRMRDKERDSW